MPGAMTFYRGEKVKILESYSLETEEQFHPFYFGRIVNTSGIGEAKIVAAKGFLIVTKIKYKDIEQSPAKTLRPPNILHTPHDILERARTVNVSSLKMPAPNEGGS